MPKVFSLAAQFCRPRREKTSNTQGGHVADRNRERTTELFQDNSLTDLSLKPNFFLSIQKPLEAIFSKTFSKIGQHSVLSIRVGVYLIVGQ